MIKQRKPLLWGFSLCCICLLAACTPSNDPQPAFTGKVISFTSDGVDIPLNAQQKSATRALDAGYEDFPTNSTFGVLAYNLKEELYDHDNHIPDIMYDNLMTKLTGFYVYTPAAHWPNTTDRVLFAAYHPHSSSVEPGALIVSPRTTAGLPRITLSLANAKSKIDFSIAVVGPLTALKGNTDPVGTPARSDYMVNFRFQRKLSELFFRAKAKDLPPLTKLYINSITLRNIYTTGEYNFKTDKWENLSGEVDGVSGATLSINSAGVAIDNQEFVDIINPHNEGSDRMGALVMIPQQYDAIELIASYTLEYLKPEGGCEYRVLGTKKIPLSVNWEAAKMYYFDLEFGFYEAYGETTPFSFTVNQWTAKEIGTEIN